MSDIVYPIECFNDQQLEATENRIFDWLATGICVHFLYHDHQLSCTHEGFYRVTTGLHPSMRFIFINPALEMDVNVFLQYLPLPILHKMEMKTVTGQLRLETGVALFVVIFS